MRTLGIIPARAGSKRCKRKNLRLLGGKPLVEWAIDAAIDSGVLASIVVSSNDPEVLDIADSYDTFMSLERPDELCSDTSPAIDYVLHALRECGDFDAIAIIQPSSPLTTADDIRGVLALLDDSGADSVVSVMKVDFAQHPAKFKTLDGDRLKPLYGEPGMAAHELPEVYVRNCAVYASRLHVIRQGKIIGDDCRGYVMPRERSIDINDELDLEFARFLVNRQ